MALLDKMSNLFPDVDFKGVGGRLLEVGERQASKRLNTIASEYVSEQLQSIVDKNRRGVDKALKILGLDRGGSSNIYDALASRPDPMLDFEFEVIMPSISTPWVSAPALKPIWIEDADIPVESFDTESFKVNAHPVNVLMHSSLSDLTLTIYGDYANVALAYIDAWYASMRLPNGRYNLPYAADNVGYKKMIQIILKKGSRPVAMFSISGCMPSSRQGYALKSAGGEVLGHVLTFSVDKVYLTMLDGLDPNRVNAVSDGTIGGSIGAGIVNAVSGVISTTIRGS